MLLLAVVVDRVGGSAVLTGLRSVTWWTALAAAGLGAAATVCCAVRWRLIGRRLGVDMSLAGAVGGCYRAQFLNSTLPGGVLGDVHRAVADGGVSGDLLSRAKAVAWERCSGQGIQLLIAAGVLAWLSAAGPVQVASGRWPLVLGAGFVAVAAVALVVACGRRRAQGRAAAAVAGMLRAARADGGRVLGHPPTVLAVAATSAAAAVAHALTFLIAARCVGAAAPPLQLVAAAVVLLPASALPLSVAGWGPREWAAMWAFAFAGLDAQTAVAVAVTFGVLALGSTVPGGCLIARDWVAGALAVRRPRMRLAPHDVASHG